MDKYCNTVEVNMEILVPPPTAENHGDVPDPAPEVPQDLR
jgi:hypothetical protein